MLLPRLQVLDASCRNAANEQSSNQEGCHQLHCDVWNSERIWSNVLKTFRFLNNGSVYILSSIYISESSALQAVLRTRMFQVHAVIISHLLTRFNFDIDLIAKWLSLSCSTGKMSFLERVLEKYYFQCISVPWTRLHDKIFVVLCVTDLYTIENDC